MSALMGLVDLYVLRRWKKYAAVRPLLRRTVLPLTVLMWAMPFVLPIYAATSRWWDGGIARGVVVGLWAFHYAPRTIIAVWLAAMDATRGFVWVVSKPFAKRAGPSDIASGQPETMLGRPEMAHRQAETDYRQPEIVQGQPEAVFGRAETTYRQPEVVGSQPEVVRGQPETIHRQPETAHRQPEVVHRQPEVVGSQPEIVRRLVTIEPTSRRDFLRTAGWAMASVPFLAVGTGLFKTVYDFEVRRVRVPIAGLPRAFSGLRIAQVSDLHAGSFFSSAPFDEAIRMLLAERPDLIVVTGDFVNHDAAELPLVLPALQRLRADLGVFGILGNHDHYADVPDVLRGVTETPVRMLVNAHQTLRVNGEALHLLGTDNTGFGQRYADLPRTLDGLAAPGEANDLRVLLTHDPTFWDEARAATGAHLTLSGHTHGGQIGWEWAQASATPRGVNLADLRYDRTAGLYTEAGAHAPQHLYINRGLGTTGPPLRLGVRPEITVLELAAA